MKNKTLKAILTLTSSALIASCGGGGGSDFGSTATGGLSNSNYSNSNYSVNLKSLSISESVPDNIIQPGETFYIKWDVSYSGADFYRIDFFGLADNNVPDSTTSPTSQFAGINCMNGITDCSKGLKCTYTKATDSYGNTKYYLSCSYYSLMTGYQGWKTLKKKEINPYTVNYLGADAMIYEYKLNGYAVNVVEHHSKKAVSINFGF